MGGYFLDFDFEIGAERSLFVFCDFGVLDQFIGGFGVDSRLEKWAGR